MPDDAVPHHHRTELEADALLGAIMRRQARLSLGVAAVFLVLVLGLPLVNQYLPRLAQQSVAGFSATWFFLGVLFYPITWLLSAYFVRASEEVEREIGEGHLSDRGEGPRPLRGHPSPQYPPDVRNG